MAVKPRYKVVGKIERFDERENVHSRNTLEPGSKEYEDFYQKHPEWKEGDDITRELSKSMPHNPLDLLFFFQEFEGVAKLGLEKVIDTPVSPDRFNLTAERATEKIKGFAHFLGADLVRIGPLNPAFIYTHIGKTYHDPDRKYATPITLNHKHAISIAMGINPDLIKTGPVISMITEVMRVYREIAKISTTIASYIRALGYSSRAHMVTNYQVLPVPIAIDAGMGELGRHGIMLTKELGSALKLTTVTTDLPLVYDAPVDIGVEEFCRDCNICAQSCPSGAISFGDKKVVRGVERWTVNAEACFRVWNETGTDCGVCVASCPWTKPRTAIHRLSALIATKKKKAGWWMSRAEKLVYGKFRPKPAPAWFETPPPVWKKYKSLR